MIKDYTLKRLASAFEYLTDVKHYEVVASEAGVSKSSVMVAASEGYLDRVSSGHYSPTVALKRYLPKPPALMSVQDTHSVEPEFDTTQDLGSASVETEGTVYYHPDMPVDVTFSTTISVTAIVAYTAIKEVLDKHVVNDSGRLAEESVRSLVAHA